MGFSWVYAVFMGGENVKFSLGFHGLFFIGFSWGPHEISHENPVNNP